MQETGLYRWMMVPMQRQLLFSLRSISKGWLKYIIPKIRRLMRATVRGKMISNWRGSFRPMIGLSQLIRQSLGWMILIPIILVRLVSCGMKGILKSYITISQRILFTTGGLKELHGETRQEKLYNILAT